MNQEYPSILLERAVSEFAKLPGVGRKTALRFVLHLLRQENQHVRQFSEAITRLKEEVQYCTNCHNISDAELCPICADTRRDRSTVCVVENIRDVMAIEATQQYRGVYHVLGGIISPMDGIGPGDLTIDMLEERVQSGEVKEIVLALNGSMEGDMTCHYLYRKLAPHNVAVSEIARGISVGDELQYADEVTLGRSILHRVPFEGAQ